MHTNQVMWLPKIIILTLFLWKALPKNFPSINGSMLLPLLPLKLPLKILLQLQLQLQLNYHPNKDPEALGENRVLRRPNQHHSNEVIPHRDCKLQTTSNLHNHNSEEPFQNIINNNKSKPNEDKNHPKTTKREDYLHPLQDTNHLLSKDEPNQFSTTPFSETHNPIWT